MLINLVYAAFPPAGEPQPPAPVTRWVEIVEQASRIAYLLAVTFLVSRKPVSVRSTWFFLAAAFLGRDVALLKRAFLFVPMPLVVFPVLYYLCAALWLHNVPAAVLMVIFGAAHLTVSLQSFQ